MGGRLRLADVPEDAYRLLSRAERLQDVALRQQELALELRRLVKQQRMLVDLWEGAGAGELTKQAQAISRDLRELSGRVLHLEREAIDVIAGTVADVARELPPR
jgi:hypothetical protein